MTRLHKLIIVENKLMKMENKHGSKNGMVNLASAQNCIIDSFKFFIDVAKDSTLSLLYPL